MTAPRTWTEDEIARVLSDPGQVIERKFEDDPYGRGTNPEPLHRWQTRALLAAFEVVEASAYHLVVAERDRLKRTIERYRDCDGSRGTYDALELAKARRALDAVLSSTGGEREPEEGGLEAPSGRPGACGRDSDVGGES